MMKLLDASASILVFLLLSGLSATGVQAQNNRQTADIDKLLEEMTLEEKIKQTQVLWIGMKEAEALVDEGSELLDESGKLNLSESMKKKLANGFGIIFFSYNKSTPLKIAKAIELMGEYVHKNSRQGIPAIFACEALTGLVMDGYTIFPQPIALASAWGPALVQEVYESIALEASAMGFHMVLSPNADIVRDARFGRMHENYGEDTYLTARLAVAAVKGLQGERTVDGHIQGPHVAATCKHFAGYGQIDRGKNFDYVRMTRREFFDDILPPFAAAIDEAGLMCIMPSHCDIDGIACHGNRYLLHDLLRGQLGFEGVVISDGADVARLHNLMKVVPSYEEAAVLGLQSGVDLELGSDTYLSLAETIAQKPELEAYLDRAVKRILTLKKQLNLLSEQAGPATQKVTDIIRSEAQMAVTEKASDASIILLKNQDDFLPLQKDKLSKVAVIGPNAANTPGFFYQVGNPNISVLEGVKDYCGDEVEVMYAKGCELLKEDTDGKRLFTLAEERPDIEEAVAVARQADVVILCLGGSGETTREATLCCGEGDRANLDLIGNQQVLFEALLETGKPIITVLIHGRANSINGLAEHSTAIVDSWRLGQTAGNSITKVLFGEINPGGKLTVSIPRSAGQLPLYYSQKHITQVKPYLLTESTPLYPFGYGLSYTTFDISNIQLSDTLLTESAEITVQVAVKNTGTWAGSEVVQLYIRDLYASVLRPQKLLKGFRKVMLQPGESQTLSFILKPEMLAFTGPEMLPIVEPGEFELLIGNSSEHYRVKKIWFE